MEQVSLSCLTSGPGFDAVCGEVPRQKLLNEVDGVVIDAGQHFTQITLPDQGR